MIGRATRPVPGDRQGGVPHLRRGGPLPAPAERHRHEAGRGQSVDHLRAARQGAGRGGPGRPPRDHPPAARREAAAAAQEAHRRSSAQQFEAMAGETPEDDAEAGAAGATPRSWPNGCRRAQRIGPLLDWQSDGATPRVIPISRTRRRGGRRSRAATARPTGRRTSSTASPHSCATTSTPSPRSRSWCSGPAT